MNPASSLKTELQKKIDDYAAGPALLRAAVAGLSASQLQTPCEPGKWSILEVVCHLSDFEIVYAERMKAILAEDGPQIPARHDDRYTARLNYSSRDLEEELCLIEAIRRQTARVLRLATDEDFQRNGQHSVDGPITLETLLSRITRHLPHHLEFIQQKKARLAGTADRT